ncbi:uncharacterized protein LOC133533434 isoform X2 [Cydia pomonella]|uniref:uncharacterized protein LOC133533434 isoform X2 n=1 Tax=Cydia pomonella TaxID=82600 RepID=UPI002ADDBDE1|nr:uncharacterized protein LOC133533434 isoform X2 [Cydia pomonella]
MEEENQLPLKRVELSLSKFNDVAIPHHLELLRQYKANIIKHEEAGQYAQVRREQAGAGRAAARLRALLAELAALRARVREPDRQAFDTRTQRSRDLTLQAIMDYLESSPMSISRSDRSTTAVAGSAVSTDSVGVVAHARARAETGQSQIEDDCDVPVLQLQVDDRELALAEREAALRGWTELQAELRALHGVWAATHAAARAQREQVLEAASHVEVAADNVQAAKAHLSTAEKLRAGAWGAGGACVGALVGGPVGLLVGAKAGAAALLAGSALGYVGARLLGHKRQEQLAIQVHWWGPGGAAGGRQGGRRRAAGRLGAGLRGRQAAGTQEAGAARYTGTLVGARWGCWWAPRRAPPRCWPARRWATWAPGCWDTRGRSSSLYRYTGGGPVGLLVGAKAGAAALLAGSALGYVGARLLGHKRQEQLAIQVHWWGPGGAAGGRQGGRRRAAGRLGAGLRGRQAAGTQEAGAARYTGTLVGARWGCWWAPRRAPPRCWPARRWATWAPGCWDTRGRSSSLYRYTGGGPVGLLVGAKAGAAALLAGSALGYVGARLLGHKRQEQLAIQVHWWGPGGAAGGRQGGRRRAAGRLGAGLRGRQAAGTQEAGAARYTGWSGALGAPAGEESAIASAVRLLLATHCSPHSPSEIVLELVNIRRYRVAIRTTVLNFMQGFNGLIKK